MAFSGSLFSQTLQNITNTKLEELAKKRNHFEDQRKAVIADAQRKEHPVEALSVLADGVKACFSVSVADGRVVRGSTDKPSLEIDLKNLDRFLAQARYDPSLSIKVMDQWRQMLLRHLDVQSLKYAYASLYGQLTTEWLESKQTQDQPADAEMKDFELVAGGKKMESRMKWEQSVFEAAPVDVDAITRMLKELFEPADEDRKQLPKALKTLRERVQEFARTLTVPGGFTTHSLRWVINGLLASDLLTDEKRDVLRDFLSNTVILTEIADMLNMRMVALEKWSWGEEVQLEQRRQLNGTFSIYMHEDLLHAIFLQYIGVKWSVFWKSTLAEFRKAKGVWKIPHQSIPPLDQKRRDYYLGSRPRRSVDSAKQKIYRKHYFVSQLMDSETQQIQGAEGDEEADFEEALAVQRPRTGGRSKQNARKSKGGKAPRKQLASQAYSRARMDVEAEVIDYSDEEMGVDGEDDEDDDDSSASKNPMENKQRLLHLLSTDILIKTRIHGDVTCFRSQFDSLYPSLPHATIKAVLSFFGVPPKWLSFFERFLQAPLRFVDDPSAAPRLRKQGTPGSHALSEVFGELVLFCLDFQVNQHTEGQTLWRLNDDFWFWSSQQKACIDAWKAITSFTKTAGLTLNTARTGSARMQRKGKGSGPKPLVAAAVDKPLPSGQIRWGMLVLNPETGRFEIDQELVDQHIEELSRQLADQTGSVFAWIQAWNSYASTFFTSNFGKPAHCYGRSHVDNMLATHERIQRRIFDSSSAAEGLEGKGIGSVTEYLKRTIHQRFSVKDIPDGYLYFPGELGGLEVRNPFVGLLQIRDSVLKDPTGRLDAFEDAERSAYDSARKAYEAGRVRPPSHDAGHFQPADPDTFLPFDEYVRHREVAGYAFRGDLRDVFLELLECPNEESLDYDENSLVKIALGALGSQPALRGILNSWYAMEPYWKWVAQLYGPEMIERFGGLNIVDQGLLPIGMVSLFRSGRVKWQE